MGPTEFDIWAPTSRHNTILCCGCHKAVKNLLLATGLVLL